MPEHHDTLIIGAGLSGLYLAWQLSRTGHDAIVLESRARPGGRILSREYQARGRVDMGPAWIWPALQLRMAALLAELDLSVFPQFTRGEMLYETATRIERYAGPSAHNQSYRIAGGAQCVIDALLEKLPSDCLKLNTHVNTIQQDDLSVQATLKGKSVEYSANKIVLALPPRIAQQCIHFSPDLPGNVLDAWRNIPTWMAMHCKMLFVYDRPFWREQGLSGEVFSQVGPLSEIYDGSPVEDEFFALTSFVGINAAQRRQLGQQQLIAASLAQLQRLFGKPSQQPLDINIKDWSPDPNTATDLDLTGPIQHPHYPNSLPRDFWDKRLLLAGTEVADEHAGYLEGALESADSVIALLQA